MRQHVHLASRRRDERLARVRRMTLWITGGAAAASLGFGTAFAHAVPGHAASTQGTGSSSSARSAGAPPSPTGTQHSQAPQSQQSQQTQLNQPAQQPTQTTAPPVVTSGGS